MNIRIGGAIAVAALLPLAACSGVDPGTGESVRINIAAQTIDPNPTYAEPASVSGQKMGAAVDRYRMDKVKKPVGISATNGGAAGAGAGGGNGGGGAGGSGSPGQ